jgi:hypothetical protein
MIDWEKEYKKLVKEGAEAIRIFEEKRTVMIPDEEPPWDRYPDDERAVKFGEEWNRQGDVADMQLDQSDAEWNQVKCYVILCMLRDFFESGIPTDIISVQTRSGIQNEDYWQDICAMLLEGRLISRVKIVKDERGEIVEFNVDDMRITSNGLEYLKDDSIIKTVQRTPEYLDDVAPFL